MRRYIVAGALLALTGCASAVGPAPGCRLDDQARCDSVRSIGEEVDEPSVAQNRPFDWESLLRMLACSAELAAAHSAIVCAP